MNQRFIKLLIQSRILLVSKDTAKYNLKNPLTYVFYLGGLLYELVWNGLSGAWRALKEITVDDIPKDPS